MTRYVVEIDGRQFAVALDAGTASVDGAPAVAAHLEDIEGTPVRLVTVGTTVHRVTARRDGARGRYTLRIDGRRFTVDALDERTRSIRDMADASRPPAGPVPLLAPMPGLIVRIHVGVGDTVSVGQPLIAIEAMKMENELRAPRAGTVVEVRVSEGTSVEANAILVVLE